MIKSFLKTATSKSKIVKRPGYQAIQVMREPLLFPVFLRRFKTENPGDETCLESKVACGVFQGVFQGQYLPSLGINYVATNKNLEKLLPKMKVCYIMIKVAIALELS